MSTTATVPGPPPILLPFSAAAASFLPPRRRTRSGTRPRSPVTPTLARSHSVTTDHLTRRELSPALELSLRSEPSNAMGRIGPLIIRSDPVSSVVSRAPFFLGARLEYYAMTDDSCDMWYEFQPSSVRQHTADPVVVYDCRFPKELSPLCLNLATNCIIECNGPSPPSSLLCSAPLKSCLTKKPKITGDESLPILMVDTNPPPLQPESSVDEGYSSPTSLCGIEDGPPSPSFTSAKRMVINGYLNPCLIISLPLYPTTQDGTKGLGEGGQGMTSASDGRSNVNSNTTQQTPTDINPSSSNEQTIVSSTHSVKHSDKTLTTEGNNDKVRRIPQNDSNTNTLPIKVKKRVKFADDVGKTLISIRLMGEPSDETPALQYLRESAAPPRSVTSLLTKSSTTLLPMSVPSQSCTTTITDDTNDSARVCSSSAIKNGVKPSAAIVYEWYPEFGPPISDYQTFRERLNTQSIALETVRVRSALSLTGNECPKLVGCLRVSNVSSTISAKYVYARVTIDGWSSWNDVVCQYVPSHTSTMAGTSSAADNLPGQMDEYVFEYNLPKPTAALKEQNARVIFALCLRSLNGSCSDNLERWDNNDGQNYGLSLRATLPLTSPSNATSLTNSAHKPESSCLSSKHQQQPLYNSNRRNGSLDLGRRGGENSFIAPMDKRDYQPPYW